MAIQIATSSLQNVKTYYFAYGSNMHEGDLKEWCRRKGYSLIVFLEKKVAVLKNYKLVFNYYSVSRGCGVANIVESKGSDVWGLLTKVSGDDYKKVREKEGYPCFYTEIDVNVTVLDENKVVPAKTFKVVKSREAKEYQPPSKYYLNLLIESARKHAFPEEYIKMLESLPTKD